MQSVFLATDPKQAMLISLFPLQIQALNISTQKRENKTTSPFPGLLCALQTSEAIL